MGPARGAQTRMSLSLWIRISLNENWRIKDHGGSTVVALVPVPVVALPSV